LTPPRPLDPRRVGLGAALLAAAVATLAAAGVLLPRSAGGESGAFLAGLLLSPLVLSLWEWSTHRYLYHRALRPWLRPVYETHHRDHHIVAFPPWRFSVDGGDAAPGPSTMYRRVLRARVGLDLPISDRGVYLAFCIVSVGTPVWLLTRRPSFLAGLLLSGLAVFQLFDAVHDAMHHRGRHAWIERQRWFAFLRRHHFVHHVDTEANLNFLLPLADVLFGTFRPAASPEEMSRVRSRGAGVSGASPSRARTSP
jgi:hypothetical protein